MLGIKRYKAKTMQLLSYKYLVEGKKQLQLKISNFYKVGVIFNQLQYTLSSSSSTRYTLFPKQGDPSKGGKKTPLSKVVQNTTEYQKKEQYIRHVDPHPEKIQINKNQLQSDVVRLNYLYNLYKVLFSRNYPTA